MHVYAINGEQREKVVCTITTIYFIVIIIWTISGAKDWILEQFNMQQNNLAYEIISRAVGLVLPISFYGCLYYFYDRVMWKWKIFQRLHGIPDLNGTWEGTVKSPLKSTPSKVDGEIIQTWSKIQVKLITKSGTESKSESAMIEITQTGEIYFSYAFKVKRDQELYPGYNRLSLDLGKNTLKGVYFTAKDLPKKPGQGTKGTFEITRGLDRKKS